MKIEIDEKSGFCFGVVNAIGKAQNALQQGDLVCLGDIVHNTKEQERLSLLGLKTIDYEQLNKTFSKTVLLRAHGEPPETYEILKRNSNTIIDASCPVVLRLQEKIKRAHEANPSAQIVIYGKIGHAEVNGLVGQTSGAALVVENEQDAAQKIDFQRDVILFSQTTMSVSGFEKLVEFIKNKIAGGAKFEFNDTICRQVANRIPHIREFSANFDLVLFVSDKKSSNGKALFQVCQQENKNSHFISSANDVNINMLQNVKTVGICGATSTPRWLMEQVAEKIENLTKF